MSREIKFRGWDGDTMTYFSLAEIDNEMHSFLTAKHLDIMQFTGLKDKNGKEIYEGDVVRCASSKRCPHEVVWMNEIPGTNLGGAPGFYLRGLNEGYAFGGEEIIGNIYENPDLI